MGGAQTTLVATFLMTTAVRPSWPVVPRTYLRIGDGSPRTVSGFGSSPKSHPLAPVSPRVGAVSLSTEGLALTPGNPLDLIQASESPSEGDALGNWFEAQWERLPAPASNAGGLLQSLQALSEHRAPDQLYALILHAIFSNQEDELDEDRVVKAATGIRETVVWKKLSATVS
jgi:hypothetical protein